MESAVPRWQEDSPLAFCQSEGGMVVVVVDEEEGGYTAEERRGKKGPEGYQCWIAAAPDSVKECRQEI